MRVRSILAATAVFVASMATVAPAAHATTEYNSVIVDASEWDPPGVITPPDFASTLSEHPVSHVVDLGYQSTSGWSSFLLALTPPSGQVFQGGTTYPFKHYASDTHAGVTDYGNACLKEGTLRIGDLARDAEGTITALAVDVSEFCADYPGTPGKYTAFRFHSTTPDPPVTRLKGPSNVIGDYGFGSAGAGYVPTPRSFALTNLAPAGSAVSDVSMSGSNPGDFTITNDGCTGQTLAENQSCTIEVAFTPTADHARSATLQVADGSLKGVRTIKLYGFKVGPPKPVTALMATERSDGVQLRWQLPTETGGHPLQYVEVLRGETAETLQHLVQLPAGATGFGDALGSATAPEADHTYVYGVRAHTLAGDGVVATVAGHTPAAATPLTAHAIITVDGAPGAPNYPMQGQIYDGSAGAIVTVTRPGVYGGLLAKGTANGVSHGLSNYVAGELTTGTYPSFGLSQSAQGGATCTPYEQKLEVHEVAYNSSGAYARLAAGYSMRCTATGPRVAGVIRWHSDLPYTAADLVTPAVDFSVKPGVTTPLVVTYRNRGTNPIAVGTLQLKPSPSTGTTAGWSVKSNGCAAKVLSGGQQCTATINVSPTALGRKEVFVAFSDDTPILQHTRKLTVYGIAAPPAPKVNVWGGGTSGINVSWTQSAPYQAAPTSWQVYRRFGTGSYSLAKTVLAPTKTWLDPDKRSGSRSYVVRGVNAAGPGPYSTAVTKLVGPQAPRSVVAAGLNHRITVNWQPPASSLTAYPLSGYAISRVSSTGALVRLATRSTSAPRSYTLPGVSPGVRATLKVQALYGSLVSPAAGAAATATSSNLLYIGPDGGLMGRAVGGGPAVRLDQRTFSLEYGIQHSSPPQFSPDRRWIVCSMHNMQGGYPYRLVVRRTDGTGTPRFLTSESLRAFSPAVSRDGKWVAFTRLANDGHTYLYRVPWSGGTPAIIPNSKDLDEPSWSYDGKSVYASRIADDKLGVVKLTLSGSRKTIGSGRNESPVVSPDGKSVAFFTRSTSNVSALKVLTVSSGSIRTLVSNTGGWASRPSWTNGSSTIYFTGLSTTGANFTKRIRRDGTGLTSLPRLASRSAFVVYEQW